MDATHMLVTNVPSLQDSDVSYIMTMMAVMLTW
jgi:hypothetical protein